jgi:hypothetical protein
MERALWCLSESCRGSLLNATSSSVVEVLVWTVKSCRGVKGVRAEAKTLMGQALAELDWSEEMFAPTGVGVDRVSLTP